MSQFRGLVTHAPEYPLTGEDAIRWNGGGFGNYARGLRDYFILLILYTTCFGER